MSDALAPEYILVIEDDEHIGEVIAMILTDEGYDVTSVRDGHAALRMIERQSPALILLDLSIANPGPERTIEAYRQTASGLAKVVVVSGHANLELRARAIGADAFVAKPFDIPILVETVQGVLSMKQQVGDRVM